jgi:hypothetical protein
MNHTLSKIVISVLLCSSINLICSEPTDVYKGVPTETVGFKIPPVDKTSKPRTFDGTNTKQTVLQWLEQKVSQLGGLQKLATGTLGSLGDYLGQGTKSILTKEQYNNLMDYMNKIKGYASSTTGATGTALYKFIGDAITKLTSQKQEGKPISQEEVSAALKQAEATAKEAQAK